jgi:hypothetical protein
MPSDRYEVRVPFRRLLIAMLTTIVPISIAGLYTLSLSERSLEKTIGTHFKTIAESTALEVSQFIHERVFDVGAMAASSAVIDEITAANRTYAGMGEAAISDRIQRIEKSWNTPASDSLVKPMLASRAARLLRRFQALDPKFLRITVTDERGAAVAATHKSLDYFQADEDFWQGIYSQGRGSVSVTDILFDEVTKSHYIGIGVPVVEEDTNRFIGTVDALVDLSTLFPFVSRLQLGPSFRASLVKEDGTIIAAPETTLSMNLKSDVYAAVRDALTSVQGRQTGYVVADVSGAPRKLIGFADTGLKDDYKNLGWIVLISQDAREAFAPTRAVGRMIAFMALLGLATVVFFGVYFSLHRTLRWTDIRAPQRAPAEKQTAAQ